jgi:hypothetical protein
VSVVSGQARRRWSIVVCAVAVLCALPAVIAALPTPQLTISAAALRARILASASVPYQGYTESTVDLGLPVLPDFHGVSTLFDGTTDQYAWYYSPGSWRTAVLTGTGENDIYQVGPWTYLWDYGHNVLTRIVGAQPVRLPRASDLLPPALARRLLAAASPADHVSRLPSRRVAGKDVAGLRLVPADPTTTIGAIDIWADPANGLPVEVTIIGRGSAKPVLVSNFLQLIERQPAYVTVIPEPAPGVVVTTTALPEVDRILSGDGDGDHDRTPFPGQLAGLRRVTISGSPAGVAAYGTGFSRLVLLPLPRGSVGPQVLAAATGAGAPTVALPHGTAVLVRTPLITVLLLHAGFRRETYILAGAVTPALLKEAGASLQAYRPERR